MNECTAVSLAEISFHCRKCLSCGRTSTCLGCYCTAAMLTGPGRALQTSISSPSTYWRLVLTLAWVEMQTGSLQVSPSILGCKVLSCRNPGAFPMILLMQQDERHVADPSLPFLLVKEANVSTGRLSLGIWSNKSHLLGSGTPL